MPIKGLKITTALKNPTTSGTLSATFWTLQGNNYHSFPRAEADNISAQAQLSCHTDEACYNNVEKESLPVMQKDSDSSQVPSTYNLSITQTDWDAATGSEAIYNAIKTAMEANVLTVVKVAKS